MNQFELQGKHFKLSTNGDAAYIITLKEEIGKPLTQKLISIASSLRSDNRFNLLEVIPSYQSLTLIVNRDSFDRIVFEKRLVSRLNEPFEYTPSESRLIEIPVCYDSQFGLDLVNVAKHCHMTTDELISLHSSQIYWVNMLGFLPGFLYLSGLRKSLYCPRKETPSIKINAGSVGIGGEQTGIYPVASPGGWNIIGQTPLKVFIPSSNHPALANPLDRIKFNPITLDEFKQLQSDEQGPQT